YVQDRWKPIRRLTIIPGIRFDWGITRNSVGQTVSNLFGVGPRLGATFDLTGDEKTIISAYYGRSNEVMSLLATSSADVKSISRTYQWNPMSKTFDFLYQSGPYVLDPKASTPHTDEVTLGLRRELFHDSVAAVEYTYKRISNIWDAVEINQIWDPSGN